MSGHRTLHRDGPYQVPFWSVVFSPCAQSRLKHRIHGVVGAGVPSALAPLRLLAASADGTVKCYRIVDKTLHDEDDGDGVISGGSTLDATALRMEAESVLIPGSVKLGGVAVLGFADVSVINIGKGEEVAAAVSLEGTVALWKRDAQPVYVEAMSVKKKVGDDDANRQVTQQGPRRIASDAEFCVDKATGTSVALCPVLHGNEVIVAVGCRDGSTALFHTGILINPDEAKSRRPVLAGTLLDKMGEGSACVMSIAWSDDGCLLSAGRKDGIVDVFSCTSSQYGGHFDAPFRRVHRVVAHSMCVRVVKFTSDGALLLTGGDDGRVHAYDIMRKKAALTGTFVGHQGWVLDISPSPDGRSFATSSSDHTVKIWDIATRQNIHTFDGHTDHVWGVAFGGGNRDESMRDLDVTRMKIASSGDDCLIQIYSGHN